MSISALIIGYGSIGKKHAQILKTLDQVSDITVLSKQKDIPFKTIHSLDEALKINPNYFVVASPTVDHYTHLHFINENYEDVKILVEKPIFNEYKNFINKKNIIYVGYNLRFHPMMDEIKENIKGKKLWNIQVICGSYLPDWRPGKDYRNTSSAKKEAGGGVLLDLSHEIDYTKWLIGPLFLEHVINQKISNLEIDTDDILLVKSKTETGAHVNFSLNYFTRKEIRLIIIDGEGISIQGDLIKNKLNIYKEDEILDFKWSDLDQNETYIKQHRAILNGDTKKICNYDEGLSTLNFIEKIRAWEN